MQLRLDAILKTLDPKVVRAVVVYHAMLIGAVVLASAKVPLDLVDPATYLRFDAVHYLRIAMHGYSGSSQAFFPMFPALWRIIGVEVHNAMLLNGLLFCISTLVLASTLRSDWMTVLLWISLPSMFFCYLPYSEATFMLGAVAMIIGVRRESFWLTLLGLFWCTLSRPAFTVLLPALWFMLLVSERAWKRRLWEGVGYSIASIVGLFAVAYYQFHQTGMWGGFYSAQSGYGNTPHLPVLPLTSWGGGAIVRLDAVALMTGVICSLFVVRQVVRKWRAEYHPLRPEIALSLGYAGSISLMILVLHGGELYSLNRFLFASPFMLVLIDHLIRTSHGFKGSHLILFVLSTTGFFLLFGSFLHIQTFLKFFGVSLALVVFLFCTDRTGALRKWAMPIWLLFSFGTQLFFLLRFLSGQWVA